MSDQKSTCFVITSLVTGGAELQTINHINAFCESNSNIFLIILSNITDDKLLSSLNISKNNILILDQPYNTPTTKALINTHIYLHKVYSFIKTHKCEVIVANLPLAHFFMRATKLYARVRGLSFKLINYHRSLQFTASPIDSLPKQLFHKYNQSLANKTDDGNIFISKASLDDMQDNFSIKRPIIIYDGIQYKNGDSSLAYNYLRSISITPDYLIVLPGRLHPAKGHLFFLDAIHKFITDNKLEPKDIFIIFAGGKNLEDTIRTEISARKLDSYIHITGIIENGLLLSLLQVADLVAVPSIHEGLGNTAIEALMQGSLVLASDAGGLPEVIQDSRNGFMFERNNQESFLSQLHKIYFNKLTIDKSVLIDDFMKRFLFESHIKQLKEYIYSL
ncbi:glycosyltransferase [Hymenobacter sp. J193]|uniref:glycosyltransferase n=1 Tax=Hymenobacter sp. J193 TaxID=2898429 RepID=UPI002151212B|nr:glycosyltransferase [Hymenobacter sp. J193]MCR5889750.1 glycosyltransferase [Hymenobacter sp. J193]